MVPRFMTTWLNRLLGLLNGLLSLIGFLLTLAIIGGAALLYLGASGNSVDVVRQVARGAGSLFAGQHTDAVAVELQIEPDKGSLRGNAELDVRALENPRSRFYFLLNDGFELENVAVRGADGVALGARTYRVSLLTVVELDEPLRANATAHVTFHYAGALSNTLGAGSSSIKPGRVLLAADSFWFPYDAQSFFSARARITLPSPFVVVHNGEGSRMIDRGRTREWEWTYERPIPGFAVVGGYFREHFRREGDRSYTVSLADDIDLDPELILSSMAEADRLFTESFGPSGFRHLTLFVDRGLRRAFNDGSGVMGASPRYFRGGDYGHNLVAHEVAHTWWGGTVSEQWLRPGTGGQWIVEGFASAAALLATEARYGSTGLARELAASAFDTERQGVVEEMSFLDNALSIRTARDTIYRKGGYVAFMLRQVLGNETYARGLRTFIDRFRYRQASAEDLRHVLEEVSGRSLATYFENWLRSDETADIEVLRTRGGTHQLTAAMGIPIEEEIDVAIIDATGGVTRRKHRIGDLIEDVPQDGHIVADPDLLWADVQRNNNRLPRRPSTRSATAYSTQRVLLHEGSGRPWDRSTLTLLGEAGRKLQVWDFDRGMAARPRWSPDGTAIAVSVSVAESLLPMILRLDANGERRSLGMGHGPAFLNDGTLVAAQGDRIARIVPGGDTATLVAHDGWELGAVRPSPTGRYVLYAAAQQTTMDIRLFDLEQNDDFSLYQWDRGGILATWAPDESAVFLVIGAGPHYRLLRLPPGGGAPERLLDGFARMTDLAASPNGRRLALAASETQSYPEEQDSLHLLDLASSTLTEFPIDDLDLQRVSWFDDEQLLISGRVVDGPDHPPLPASYTVRRFWPSSGETSTYP